MIKIVLVDDLMATRQGLRMLLELEPDVIVVGEAGDGAEALELVDRVRPDVIVLDAEMPRMDGIAAIEALRERGDGVVTVVHSIHDDAATRARAAAAGAAAFVSKHEGYPVLLGTIRALCSGCSWCGSSR